MDHLVDGGQHILQCVGRVGIVNDSTEPLGGADGFEATVDGMQVGEHAQRLILWFAETEGGAIDCQQIADVEASDEAHAHLHAVNVQQHAFNAFFENLPFVVRCGAGGVGVNLRGSVLHHEESVAVVGVGDGERLFVQSVKECLFRVAIVFKGLVIVQVVARQVCEDASREVQSADAFLCDGVGGAFHEGIVAALLHHLCQERVEGDGVGCGVVRFDGLSVNVVANGGA